MLRNRQRWWTIVGAGLLLSLGLSATGWSAPRPERERVPVKGYGSSFHHYGYRITEGEAIRRYRASGLNPQLTHLMIHFIREHPSRDGTVIWVPPKRR